MVKRKLCVSVSVCLRYACVCVFVCTPVRCLCVCKVSLPCVYVQYVCIWQMHSSFAMVLKLCDLLTCFITLEAITSSGKLLSVCMSGASKMLWLARTTPSFSLFLSLPSLSLLSQSISCLVEPPHLNPSIITASPPL